MELVVVGSPAFMAPEQIKGLEIGPATDLWALGATLYFAVEGEPPFKSTKAQFEVLNAIVNDPPRPAERLGQLAPAIDRLLSKEPEGRPRSADVWYQLRRIAAGQVDEAAESVADGGQDAGDAETLQPDQAREGGERGGPGEDAEPDAVPAAAGGVGNGAGAAGAPGEGTWLRRRLRRSGG
jgi:hypothetical protein